MPNVNFNPYIMFKGSCGEAMAFYKAIFGGELTTVTFGESNTPHEEAMKDKLMHAELKGSVVHIMGSDYDGLQDHHEPRISLSLGGTDEAALRGYFEKLCEGGTIVTDLKTESWGDTFGMVDDAFGIRWMVNIAAEAVAS